VQQKKQKMVSFKGMGLLALFACLSLASASSLPVPLLTWSDQPQKTPSYVTYGQTKPVTEVFERLIKPTVGKSLVLVFLQDELSGDDLVKYADSFQHLKKVMDTKKNEFVPSVSKETTTLGDLLSGVVGAHGVEVVDSGSLNEWKYNGKKNVVVFNLEPVSGSSSQGRGDILKRNDQVMHLITKTLRLEGTKHFEVVFTGEEPSQAVANLLLNEEIADVSFGSRHLLGDDASTAAPAVTKRLFDNQCVLLFTKSIKITDGDASVELIKPETEWKPQLGCGSANVGSCMIKLSTKDATGDFSNVELVIEFKNNTEEWHCDRINLKYDLMMNRTNESTTVHRDTHFDCGTNSSSFASPIYDSIRAPNGMSFACHDLTFQNKNITTGPDGKHEIKILSTLSLGGAQVQPFCGQNTNAITQFDGAYHCVGFFTIPILTGIFVTVVLMLGLYMGIMMMMAIQVQDRYDDPKGKSISVATTQHE